MPGFLRNSRAAQNFFFAKTDLRFFVFVAFLYFFVFVAFSGCETIRHFFCIQNLKPNILEFFVRPNSKCEIVNYPMVMLA